MSLQTEPTFNLQRHIESYELAGEQGGVRLSEFMQRVREAEAAFDAITNGRPVIYPEELDPDNLPVHMIYRAVYLGRHTIKGLGSNRIVLAQAERQRTGLKPNVSALIRPELLSKALEGGRTRRQIKLLAPYKLAEISDLLDQQYSPTDARLLGAFSLDSSGAALSDVTQTRLARFGAVVDDVKLAVDVGEKGLNPL